MAKFIIAALFLACSACKTGAGLGSAPIKLSVSSWPEADALFRKDPRWLGGDGAFSVDLGGERTLWLFGDSFVATSAANERAESKMVRNSIAVQTGRDPAAADIVFHWRQSDGAPASFFAEDGAAWFWPMHGLRLETGLLLVLSRCATRTLGRWGSRPMAGRRGESRTPTSLRRAGPWTRSRYPRWRSHWSAA